MDLRIATTILFFLSLYLYANALDDHEKRHGTSHKHPVQIRKKTHHYKVPLQTRQKTHHHKVPVRKTRKGPSVKFAKMQKGKPTVSRRMMSIPKLTKNEDIQNSSLLENRKNLQENTRNDEEIVIVEPSIDNQIEDTEANRKDKDDLATEKTVTGDQSDTFVKEIIYIRGLVDILNLLKGNIVLDESIEDQANTKKNEMAVNKVKDGFGQRANTEEGEEEELIEENESAENGRKFSNEEIKEDPKTYRKYIMMRDKDGPYGRNLQEDDDSSRRSFGVKEVDKKIINKDHILPDQRSYAENEEEDDYPVEGNNRKEIKDDSKTYRKYIMMRDKDGPYGRNLQEDDDSSRRSFGIKEVNKQIINKDHILPYQRSNAENEEEDDSPIERKMESQTYSLEPESDSMDIFGERRYSAPEEKLSTGNIERKYGIQTYSSDGVAEPEITREYIIVRNKELNPSRRLISKPDNKC